MFTVTKTISTSHMGDDCKVRYSAVMDILQDCSNFHIDTETKVVEYFEKEKVGMYVIYRQVDIHRLPVYNECVDVATAVYECKSIYGFRNTSILDKDGNRLVSSYVAGAFVDLKTGKPAKVPQVLIDTVDMGDKLDMEYLPRKITLPDEKEFAPRGVVHVRRSMLDFNHHVNNARYFDIAEDVLPDEFAGAKAKRYDRMRIEYRSPAKYGDVIVPYVAQKGTAFYVVLREFGNAKNVFCVIEYNIMG